MTQWELTDCKQSQWLFRLLFFAEGLVSCLYLGLLGLNYVHLIDSSCSNKSLPTQEITSNDNMGTSEKTT